MMTFFNRRPALLLTAMVLVTSACGGNAAVPSTAVNGAGSAFGFSSAARNSITPEDTTPILKGLKKDVVIGSTVDPTNGDMGPRGLSEVASAGTGKLKKGQLLLCNFEDSSGAAGKGTTVELLDPTPGSKPATFAQNADIEGCSGVSVSPANDKVYVSGLTSGEDVGFAPTGKLGKTWGKPLVAPFSIVDAACVGGASKCGYSAEYVYTSDAETGGVVSHSVNTYGKKTPTEVISGFAVNKATGWSASGPSVAFTSAVKGGTLYVADGPDNTVVTINNVTSLLVKSEIVVQKGGKTFKCKYPATSCGKLVKAGKPLNAPLAMALLPNGNLIVANTGDNTLVELTSAGKVLATKVVDKSKKPGVFALVAIGTNDSNTALFFADRNTNNIHELLQ
jgi:hypothetical protein